jgi:H+/gluconate symporter-like permease
MEIFGIILSVLMMIFYAYRGVSVLVLAPLLALLPVFAGGDASLLAHYTQIFMVKLGGFVTTYFPLFLLSAIFGKMMENSGSARSIANYISDKIGANNAISAVAISCSILTYGGISLFVVAFTVYPIAVELFKKSDTPKRLIPGAIAIGSFTFTMTSLPGSPAIQNVIPSQYFGTSTFAAPGIGIICSLLTFALGIIWMRYRRRVAKRNNEGYGAEDSEGADATPKELPNFWTAITPVSLVAIVSYLCINYVFPNMDVSYLQDKKFGAVKLSAVAGNWSIIVAVFVAILFVVTVNLKRLEVLKCLNVGALDSLGPIFNTSAVVGYGAVICGLTGFEVIRDSMFALFPQSPVASAAVVTGVLSGITGSASGAIGISLEMFGAKFLEMANAAGVSPELLHRAIAMASGTLHALPHNGAFISLLAICGLTHRQSYKDLCVVCLGATTVALIAAILINALFCTF